MRYTEASNASASPKRDPTLLGYEPLEPQPPKKSPLNIQPLDTSVSLPPKIAKLGLGSPSENEGYDSERQEGTLQAYQPVREGVLLYACIVFHSLGERNFVAFCASLWNEGTDKAIGARGPQFQPSFSNLRFLTRNAIWFSKQQSNVSGIAISGLPLA